MNFQNLQFEYFEKDKNINKDVVNNTDFNILNQILEDLIIMSQNKNTPKEQLSIYSSILSTIAAKQKLLEKNNVTTEDIITENSISLLSIIGKSRRYEKEQEILSN